MKILFKSLLVWLLLLALPFQGYASATMLPCAPKQASAAMHDMKHMANMTNMATMSAPGHDHQKMLAAQAAARETQPAAHHAQATVHDGQGAAMHGASGGDGVSTSHHDGGNCKSCAACCPANLMSMALRVAADSPHFAVAPFITGFVPVVDLALPERPPQATST